MRKGFHKRAEESTACQRLLLILSDTCQASLVERSPQRFVQVPPEFLPQLTFPQALSPNRNRRGQLGTIRDLLGRFPLTARLPSPCHPLRSTLAHCSGSNLQRDGTDAKTPHTNPISHLSMIDLVVSHTLPHKTIRLSKPLEHPLTHNAKVLQV